MNTPATSSDELATLAGRVLAGGNPLDNEQILAILDRDLRQLGIGMSDVTNAMVSIRSVFGPYFDNMLSLAGSVLRQKEEIGDMILVPLEINWEHVADAMVGVVENGMSSWIDRIEPNDDEVSQDLYRSIRSKDGIWYAVDDYWRDGGQMLVRYDKGTSGGEDSTMVVGKAEIALGLGIMAKKYGHHFADMMNETGDAITDDVFIQCVILGEIVYG